MEKDTISEDRDDFKSCVEAEREQRKESQDDLNFAKLSKQWSEEDIAQRKEEGRPCLTVNRLPSFIKQVTNDGRLNRPSINIKPVGSGANKDTAGILSDLVRNIETMSQAPSVYDTAFDFAVSCGVGYFRVNVDYACEDEWDQDISLSRISNPFSVYGDYESKEATSIDWNRAYVTDWYSKAAFEQKWGKGRETVSFDTGGDEYDKDWFEDKRIRVAERWLREEVPVQLLKLSNGVVMLEPEFMKILPTLQEQGVVVVGDRPSRSYRVRQRLITGREILEENEWLGKYIPIIPMYGEEVNVNGKRHFISLIRRAKDAQRMVNYWKTVSTEVVALQPRAPFIGAVGQFDTDEAKWSSANRSSHAYIEYDVVDGAPPPQRQMFAGVPAGALQMELSASDDMKAIMGLYDASLGQRSNETSGIAINARKREGDTSTFDFIDNRNKAVEHGGRIVLDLMPRVYSVERIMRCVQEDGSTYTVPVNQPVAPKAALEAVMQGQPGMPGGPQGMPQGMPMEQPDEQGPPEYVPLPAEIPPEKVAQLKAITKIFDITTGKYDVIVTAGPGFTTRREEAAQQMMEFIRIFPQSAPLIGDLLAKNLDWPGSEQVSERLKAMLPPQAQGKIPPMVQHLQQMLQQQDGHAKQAVATLQAQIADLTKKLADKTTEDAIKKYDAETKRIGELTTAAEIGMGVTRDPATGAVVVAPLEVPPKAPSPDLVIEAGLKKREYDIKDRELAMREAQVSSDVHAQNTATQAQQVQQIDLPAMAMQQHAEHSQAVAQALHTVAANLSQKPVRKRAKAVKQPDGSYVMESIEEPVEPAMPPEGIQ